MYLSRQGSSQTERFNDLRSQHLATTIENEMTSVPYAKTLEDVGSVMLLWSIKRMPCVFVTTISTHAPRPPHTMHS